MTLIYDDTILGKLQLFLVDNVQSLTTSFLFRPLIFVTDKVYTLHLIIIFTALLCPYPAIKTLQSIFYSTTPSEILFL